MRRIVGLQFELIITTALLVGAALLFGGFLLLHLTEQKLIEQQLKHVRSTIQLVGRSIASDIQSNGEIDRDELRVLLTGLDLELDGWEYYNQFMQPTEEYNSVRESRRPIVLAQLARLSTEPQMQLEAPSFWLPFKETSAGWIDSAKALRAADRRFVGVVWLRFPLANVQQQVASTRQLVFIYVLLYGLVLTVFGVVVLRRNVVQPVNRLREATASVAAGDLTTHVVVDGPREILELGQSFNQMTDALRNGRDELLSSERMASVGHLSAGMAHEIGNPLAAIIGYLEMLKADVSEGAQRDLVRRSLEETARIDRLIRDLLDYATPTEAVAEPVELFTVLTNTVQSLQNQTVFDGYTLELECPKGLPLVRINPHKLTQVLVNLVSNARDASEKGSAIFVSAFHTDRDVLISVRDHGEGVDAETRTQIFDPFFSTKPEGEGRGLGLTICHRIIDEAGGRIEVVSEDNSGSTFIVRLPIKDGTKA